MMRWRLFPSEVATGLALAMACLLAPLPALVLSRRQRDRALSAARNAREEAEQLKLQLENVRYRTARLREELSAADQQARLSHQLTLLGQFTAGFMHEFNNPMAIVTSRIEVLLEERNADTALSGDLQQMLTEMRYMGNIARTLLQALRRERGSEVFAPSAPSEALEEALAAILPSVNEQGVRLVREIADVPRVNLPGHVVSEVVRGLLSNALHALRGREAATIWIRLEPYRSAGAKVVLRIEDNGPGVPEGIREHLFEPFVSQSPGRERLGLGLFLGASLLNMHDGRLWYEERSGGGASFVIEIPPARFTRGQPYHWFVGGNQA
jgi:two-component system C4-dicarboxylate transport sensor histidine kinase DctB